MTAPARHRRAQARRRHLPALLAAAGALVVAVVIGASTSTSSVLDNVAAQQSAAVATPAAETVTVTVPQVRTTEQVLEDYVVAAAVRAGWTQHTTAAGAVTAARTVCSALDAQPTSAALTAVLGNIETTYPTLPIIDAWALADVGVRALCPQHQELLP